MTDYKNFTKKELIEKWWRMWDENLICCPPEALKEFTDWEVLYDILWEKCIVWKDYLDDDTRFWVTPQWYLISQLLNFNN